MPRAYAEAQRLQRSLPVAAPLADQARALNLLARTELYLAMTEPAAQHARQAMELARQSGDRAEQAEADLVVAVNAINQGRIGVAAAATDRALSILDGVDRPDLLAEAMLRTAMMYRRKGKFDESVTTAMQQMEIAKRVNTPLVMTYAYHGLGMSFDHSGRPKEASEHFRRMLEQAREIPSRRLVADALLGLGGVQHQLGEARAAEASFQQAIAIYRSTGCPFCMARGLFTLGDFLMHQRRHAEALPLFGEAAALQERHANRIGLWWTLKTRSETWQALGRLDAAQADAERSHALAKEVGAALYLGESAKRLAAIAAARGDHGQAYRFAREAMEMVERADRERASARILELTERYETESKQREINELTHRNEQQTAELRQRELQQRWLWIVLGGGAVTLAGTVYFLLRLRRSKRMLEALNARMQQAQNKLQATMDAIPDLLFVLDIDGRCHDFHSPRTDLLAAPAQDLIGRTVAEVLPTEAAAACMLALREAQDKGFSTGGQFLLVLPQGQRWFELSVARKSVAPGEKPRFVLLARDITERKAHIRDLQRWQDIFEHAEWGVVVGSVDGRTLDLMNPAFARMHGYTVEELTGQSLLEVFAPDHRESVPEHIRLAHQKGHHAFESWHLRKDGTIFPVFIDVTTVRGPSGEVTHRIVNVQDITERKEAERLLHEQEQAIRAVVENSPDAITRFDRQCRRVYANSVTQKLFGLPPEQILGRTPQEGSPLPTSFVDMLQGVFASGRPSQAELPFLRADDEMGWCDVRLVPEFGSDGQITSVLSIGTDISARKVAEDALRESEEKYRTLIQKIQAAVVVHGADTRILTSNVVAQQILGLSEAQLDGKAAIDPAWHFFHEDGSPLLLDEYPVNQVLASRQPLRDLVLGVHRPGFENDVWALVNADPMFDKNEEVAQVIVTFIDITHRKRAEEALAAREREFRALAENLPDTVVRFDRECQRIYVNQAVVSMTGREPVELLGRLPVDYTPVVDADGYQEKLRRVIDEGRPSSLEVQVRRADGQAGWWWVNMVPEFDGAGQVVGAMAVGRDITERKRLEEALVFREREFRTLAENSPDIIMRYDIDCQRTYVNPAYVRETHVPMTDALNVTPRAQWHVSITPPVEEYLGVLRKVMASGEPADLTVSWRRTTDGSTVFHALRIVAERDAEDRVVGTLAIGRNITAQKLVEQELKEREERYRGIFDNVLDTLYLLEVTPEGRFRNLEVNPAFEKSSGMSSAELVGKFIEETVPQEVAEIVTAKYRRCIEAGAAIDEEVVLDLPNGQRYYHSTLVPVRDASGRIHRIVGISRDITERKRLEEELTVREREFRTLAENLPDVVIRYDRECRRLYVNAALATMAGSPPDELLGQSPQGHTPLVDPERYLDELRRTVTEGAPRSLEVEVRRAGGETGWYLSSFVPEFDADGAVIGALVVARDITERKRLEEELTVREREFRTLAENLPDPIFRYDRDCRRLYVNPVVGRILGKPVEALIGTSPVDGAILVSEQNRRLMQTIRQVFDSGEPVDCDLDFLAQDGRHRDYHMLLVPEYDAAGRVATVLALARDFTAIRDAERRMSHFLENMPGFVYTLRRSPEGHFSLPFVSASITDLFGLQPEDVKDDQAPLRTLVHPDDEPRIDQAVAESGRTMTPFQVEFRVRRPGQPERWIESRARPEREPEGGTLWHGLMLDATERKQMEFHLEESRHLLRQLAARNEAAREDERRHLKREIHDELGQRLLALRWGVSFVEIRFGETNAPLQEKTQRLIEMVDSTIKVVRNVVASLRPAALDMGIVSALEWLAGEYAERTGIQCELHVTEDEILLDDTYATALFRIVQESLTNVVRHAQASKVEITLERNETDYLLEVRDNGRGFDPAIRKEKSFGLVGIRERVLMLGGRIDISSGLGRGTSIRVHIPIHNVVTNALSES